MGVLIVLFTLKAKAIIEKKMPTNWTFEIQDILLS